MIIRQAAGAVQMGLVAGVLACFSLRVGQPGGIALLVVAGVIAITGWSITGGARWARYVAILVAVAFVGAGAYGVYGLVSLMDDGGISRFNLAVLAVLLLMGISSIVLLALLTGTLHSAEDSIRIAQRRRASLVVFGLVVGIAASVVFSLWLSTLTDPPCCSASKAGAVFGSVRRLVSV